MAAARAPNTLAPPAHYESAVSTEQPQQDEDEDAESTRQLEEIVRRLEVGAADSIVGCSDGKSAALIRYVQLNQHRSEALTLFHRDQAEWMERKLRAGEGLRRAMGDDDVKRQRQLARQAAARDRHARVRARKATEQVISSSPVVGS
jgi:hypothetical protein